MYSASTPNMRLKFMPPPTTAKGEFPTKLATSWRPMPSPPPAVKLKRLKSDCAEAETMNPQTVSNKSIRFLNLNLDLLFHGTTLLQPFICNHYCLSAWMRFSVETRLAASPLAPPMSLTYNRRRGKPRLYSVSVRTGLVSGRRPAPGVNLSIKHRPILAQQVSTRLGCQVQTIAQERIANAAVPFRPIDVRQSLGQQRPGQPRPVYDVASIVVARHEHALARILHGVGQAWFDLRIKTRILVQCGRQHKRPEKIAGRLARHRRPESFRVSVPSLPAPGWRIIPLSERRTHGRPGQRVHGEAVVHEQLKFSPCRKRFRAGRDVGENDGLLLQQIVQGHRPDLRRFA